MRMFRTFLLGAGLLLASCSFDPAGFDSDAGLPDLDVGANNATTANNGTTGGNVATNNATTNNASNNTTRDAGQPDAADTPDAAADMGPTMCDGRVVNLQTSNQHCGECGNACDPEFGMCRRGTCECIDPYGACGNDNTCTDKLIDPNNCGTCGTVCDTGQWCNSGSCECLPGLTLCNNECVDANNDPRHCGGCNMPCNDTACRDGECRGGNSCGAFVFECPRDTGGTQCVDDANSPLSCEANVLDECGEVCSGNEICYRPALIEPRRCRAYRPARGCVGCPCGDCSDAGENCVELDAYPDKPFCVN